MRRGPATRASSSSSDARAAKSPRLVFESPSEATELDGSKVFADLSTAPRLRIPRTPALPEPCDCAESSSSE
eukprot:1755065-Amphidinium_carterae.1